VPFGTHVSVRIYATLSRSSYTCSASGSRSSCLIDSWGLAVARWADPPGITLSRVARHFMRSPLAGRAILIVEDEPLIDIAQAFEQVGALITTTNTLRHALVFVENDGRQLPS
jgi:hypothetical protein